MYTFNPNEKYQMWQGDCLELMQHIPDGSVDLVMTSPPYAMQRKDTYGGISVEGYTNWFLPIAAELKRILKPTGSFILNIKEHVENGQRSTYLFELVIALKKQGWFWIEEYIWHKPNPVPGKWPNRLKDGWEHCYHFTKQAKFNMYQDAVRVKVNKSTLVIKPTQKQKIRQISPNGSPFGITKANLVNEWVLPSNVVSVPIYFSGAGHPAAYPIELPDFFTRLFTGKNDCVLDPFLGSGTTILAAYNQGRRAIGIERDANYYNIACRRLAEAQQQLRFEEMVG